MEEKECYRLDQGNGVQGNGVRLAYVHLRVAGCKLRVER
jgi:hypothetical protein